LICPLLEGDFSGSFESDLFDSTWNSENIEELNKSLEMALSSDEDRLGLGSPDSGIHMSNFDFDIEGCSALLSGNDPNLNTAEILEDKPVNCNELTLPVNSENFDIISPMESDLEEDQENIAVDTNSTKTIEIHSYSVMKIKKPKTLRSRRPRPATGSRKQLTITNQGQKFAIPLKNGKKKLYECDPLNDPIAERNRLNALNAKKNRDRKKQELMQATVEIEKLREENDELRAETDSYRDQLDEAKRELEQLKLMLKLKGGSLLDAREE